MLLRDKAEPSPTSAKRFFEGFKSQFRHRLSSAKPELRIIRRGSKTILIPVVELERWVDHSAARWAS